MDHNYETFIRNIADSLYDDVISLKHPEVDYTNSIKLLLMYYEVKEEYEKCTILKNINKPSNENK